MFDIFNKKKLKTYRLLTDIQCNLINRLIADLEKLLEKKEKAETISANQADITRNEISVLQIDLEEANKKVSALSDENEKLKEELKKFDEEHYCVTFCKRNSALDEVSNATKCSD